MSRADAIPEMVVQPGDDPAVCLGCDLSPACPNIFPRCFEQPPCPA